MTAEIHNSWDDLATQPNLPQGDLLKRYRGRVDASKKWREDEGYDRTWKRMRDLYRLKMLTGDSKSDAVAVAVAFATINVIEPSVAVNHPKITVNAREEEEDDKATITEAVVNYWWQHYDIQPEFRRSVKDFLVYGHGWLKVGYRYEEADQPIDPQQQAEMRDALSAQADQFAAENPHLAGDVPTDQEISDGVPETEPVPVADRPFVERVAPADVFVDPEATSIADMAWIAQKIMRPLEEVKRDKRYESRVRNKLDADGAVKWHDEDRRNYVPDDAKRVTLWEFYDCKRKTMCVFANSGDGFLIKPQPMPYSYGVPFVMLRDYDVPDTFYPIGEIEAIEPLQDELNETRTDMVIARKGTRRKWLYRKDAFDAKGLSALADDGDNVAVPLRDDTPLTEALMAVPMPTSDAQLFAQHSDTVLSDIDRVTGVSEYQRGEIPETRRTATEASIIQDAANARVADKLDRIESFIGQVARRLVALAQQYMSTEQTVRVVGPAGKMWVPFNADDITGEFDFSVEAGSTQPKNETFKRQSAIQMANALAPFVGSVIDPAALVVHLLKEGYGIKNPERFLVPPPDPNAPQEPDIKLIESIAYKDVPPDIQRQMEAAAGLEPSVVGGSSPVEQGVGEPSPGEDQNAKGKKKDHASENAAGGSEGGPAGKQLQGQVGLDTPNYGQGALGA